MSKVIVATDRATRMAVAKAETVADFLLNEVMLREGCSSEIWSDRGFMSEVVGVSKVVLDQSGSTLQDIILSAMD